MKNLFRISITVSIALVLLTFLPTYANELAEKKAVAASQEWLKLVDNGRYEASWDSASTLFRSTVKKDQWKQQLSAILDSIGKVKSRKLRSKHYATSLPGAPDGEYVVIQYETSFEKKRSAIETITPMLDKDGTWRVSGYYIK
jgi:hypothetical protein